MRNFGNVLVSSLIVLAATAAEARVAALFVAGQSLRDIAERLGISLHTVRQHMKKIQAKTDTNRQASLVQRMLQAVPRLLELH